MFVYLKIIIIFALLNQTCNFDNLKKYPISVFIPKGLNAVPIARLFNDTKSGTYIMEIWKDIKEFEGYYQVSNLGRIVRLERKVKNHRSNKIIQKRIKTQTISHKGYCIVNLYRNNKDKIMRVHRLAAMAFIPNPKDKPCINHKNGIKTDNHIDNLEWCTHLENTAHAHENNLVNILKGEDNGMAKLTALDVREIRILREKGIRHEILSKIYGVCVQNISLIINKKRWAHIK